jgi:hypothetical protein
MIKPLADKTSNRPLAKWKGQLVKVYKSAQDDIVMALTKLDISPYREDKAMQTQIKIGGILLQLKKESQDWGKQAFNTVYMEKVRQNSVQIEILGAERAPGFSQAVHAYSILDYYSQTMKDLNTAWDGARMSAAQYIQAVRAAAQAAMQIQAFDTEDFAWASKVIQSRAVEAAREGWSRKQLSDVIKDILQRKIGLGQLVTVKGRNYTLDYYAEMVARTRIRECQTQATINTCSEYAEDLVQFSQHDSPCAECKKYEGRVFSLSGKSTKYPKLEKKPPIHPNCEHDITPTSEIAIRVSRKYGR